MIISSYFYNIYIQKSGYDEKKAKKDRIPNYL